MGIVTKKAFDTFGATQEILGLVPDLETTPIDSSCCGMAGSFGYQSETFETSAAMGEISLLPEIRKADTQTLIIANGISCRHQIHDLSGRTASHAVQILSRAMLDR